MIRHKNFISTLLMLAVAITSSSVINAFAANDIENNIVNDSDIVIKADDKILVENKDYTLEYKDNIKVGTAKVIVHFIGNYSGEKEQTFNIVKKSSGSSGGGGGGSSAPNATSTPTPTSSPASTPETTSPPAENTEPEDIKNSEENIHLSYINGYDDNTVRPDAPITRAEAAAILIRTLDIPDGSQTKTFSDVSPADWFYTDISKMSSAGIITGYEDGSFCPNSPVSREEFVAMLVRNGEVLSFDDIPFTDVESDVWSSDYIYTAFTKGYINGYEDNTFKPAAYISRAEAVKILNGVLGRNDFSSTENPFSDLNANHWAYKHVLEAAVEHNFK